MFLLCSGFFCRCYLFLISFYFYTSSKFIKCFFTLLGPVSIYPRSGLHAPWVVFLSNCAGGAVTVFTAL